LIYFFFKCPHFKPVGAFTQQILLHNGFLAKATLEGEKKNTKNTKQKALKWTAAIIKRIT